MFVQQPSVRDGTARERARDDLFEALRSSAEYYPEWCELRLLDAHLPAIAGDVGSNARVLEYGDGGIKTRRLVEALDQAPARERARALVYCPHAPFDRVAPSDAVRTLAQLAQFAGEDAHLVVAADGTRDGQKLLGAYDGITAVWDEPRARVALCGPAGVFHAYKHSVLAMRGMLVASGWDVIAAHTAPSHDVRLWCCVRR